MLIKIFSFPRSSTLEFTDLTQEEINESYQNLITLLTGIDDDVLFQIANSIWYRESIPVEQKFIDINKQYFDAEVSALNFSDPGASDIINNWVKRKTGGKIKKIVPDDIPFDTFMYLINAIYFNGTWTYKFDPKKTHDGDFYLLDGSTKTCKMMNQTARVYLSTHELFQAMDLPYGSGLFNMTIILPNPSVDIDNLIGTLQISDWTELTQQFTERTTMQLEIPKFKFEYEIMLNDVLESLGMGIAFSMFEADFSKIVKDVQAYISEVKHKAFIDVNEEGTEAAAVTSVEMSFTSAPSPFVVNRPFVFVIHEKKTQAILFMGKIVDPVYN